MFFKNGDIESTNRWSWRDWWSNFDWEGTKAQVDRESRARVLLLGLAGAGKSTLFNRLCGWTVSPPNATTTTVGESKIEDFGLFCLVDLPEDGNEAVTGLNLSRIYEPVNGRPAATEPIIVDGFDPWLLIEGADLLVYVLDGPNAVQAADFRWISRLRRQGLPLLVVLNKCDLFEANLAEVKQRLAATVLAVSALSGTNVETQLIPAMVAACPNLAVALGRELTHFRRQAARRLIGRTAIINGFIALEPVPLLDLPFQLVNLIGMMLRIAAIYNRPPTASHRREVVAAVAGGLAGRFLAQQLAKVVPVIGWLVSGLIGVSSTWLLGQAAVTYFEAGGEAVLTQQLARTREGLAQTRRTLQIRWQRWVIKPLRRLPRPRRWWERR